MPRYQVPQQDVVGTQPQARVTSQFVQAKYIPPELREYADLRQFSPTLNSFFQAAHEDEVQRQIAAGEASVALKRPFGSPIAYTPAEEANRKQVEGLVNKGEMARSNSPYFRLGQVSMEAQRAVLNLQDHALSEDTLRSMSVQTDANGNMVLNHADVDGELDRMAGEFLNIPAMANPYAKKVAIDMLQGVRAKFHTAVAARRDDEAQKYTEAETSRQLVGRMSELYGLKQDTTDEGKKLYSDSLAGFDMIRVQMTQKPGLADPKGTFRSAARSFAMTLAEAGHGQEAIDMLREFKIGDGVTIGSDTSVDGINFRLQVDRMEEDYQRDADRMEERKSRKIQNDRRDALMAFDQQIAQADWVGNPLKAKQALRIAANASNSPYESDYIAAIEQRYSNELKAIAPDPLVNEEVQRRLNKEGPDATKAWLDTKADTGEIPWTQANDQKAVVDKAHAEYASTPEVRDMRASIGSLVGSLTQGRSTDAQQDLERFRDETIDNALTEIRVEVSKLPPEDAAGRTAAVSKALSNAKNTIKAKADGLREAQRNLENVRRERNEKGVSVRGLILTASRAGVIDTQQTDKFLADDDSLTSPVAYLKSADVSTAVSGAFGGVDLSLIRPGLVSDVRGLAQKEVRDFYRDNRGKMSPDEFDLAFTTWAQTDLAQKLLGAASTTESVGGTMTTVGERVRKGLSTESEGAQIQLDQSEGQAIMQGVKALQAGNAEDLRIKSQAAWAVPKDMKLPSVKMMAESYGVSAVGVREARTAAREHFGRVPFDRALAGDQVKQIEARRLLMKTGFPSPDEMLAGKIGDVPIDPKDVNIWTQSVFHNRESYDSWMAKSPEKVASLAKRYGVDVGNPAEFKTWKATQAALIEGASYTRSKPEPHGWDIFDQ